VAATDAATTDRRASASMVAVSRDPIARGVAVLRHPWAV
jgi:hypothetical protein